MSNFLEKEKVARKWAIWIIFFMIGIWIVLSVFSFVDSPSRKRPQTVNIDFNGQSALRGKQVFQAYNGMDCHTIVGNGAYFAPDLTKIYEKTGPAWLKAYLGSPGTYPTEAIVNVNFQGLKNAGLVKEADFDEYLKDYPDAKKRIDRRGGIEALMPNLGFSGKEIDALIAFFKYTSQLNTGGWPPPVIADPKVIDREADELESQSGIIRNQPTTNNQPAANGDANTGGASQIELGKQLTAQLGCAACHSDNGSKVIGPTFKGLFGSNVTLQGGQQVKADEEYIKNSILHPNDQIVNGFSPNVMPSFNGIIKDDQIEDIISYIKSLK